MRRCWRQKREGQGFARYGLDSSIGANEGSSLAHLGSNSANKVSRDFEHYVWQGRSRRWPLSARVPPHELAHILGEPREATSILSPKFTALNPRPRSLLFGSLTVMTTSPQEIRLRELRYLGIPEPMEPFRVDG